MTDSLTPTDLRKAAARAAWGVGGLVASAASTAFVAPVAVPICACAGFAALVLCCGSALRIAHLDDIVFERRRFWIAPQSPDPDLPTGNAVRARKGFALVSRRPGDGTADLPERSSDVQSGVRGR